MFVSSLLDLSCFWSPDAICMLHFVTCSVFKLVIQMTRRCQEPCNVTFIIININSVCHVKWVPAIAVWRVLRLLVKDAA
jgi:hypothetical protein